MSLELINPPPLGKPSGYSNGVLAGAYGKLLFIAGQIAWDTDHQIVSDDLVEQFDQALANVLTVVKFAGGFPTDVARLVIYVTDKSEYLDHTEEIGEVYRNRMGKHFPAMVLVEVAKLLDDDAKVEIEGTAVIHG